MTTSPGFFTLSTWSLIRLIVSAGKAGKEIYSRTIIRSSPGIGHAAVFCGKREHEYPGFPFDIDNGRDFRLVPVFAGAGDV